VKPFLPLLLLLSLPAGAQVSPYTHINFNWTYTPNLPACGSSLKSCFSGFIMKDIVTNQVVATIAGSARSWVYTPTGGVLYATYQFNLYATGYDANGVAVHSDPDMVSIPVVAPPAAPTGLMGKPQ